MSDDKPAKPKRQTPFSPGGSHYRPPRGEGWGGAATGGTWQDVTSANQPTPDAKSTGHAVAAAVRAQIAEKRMELVQKLLDLSASAENEAVQLSATNAALDRLMGKPGIAAGDGPDAGPLQLLIHTGIIRPDGTSAD